MTLKTDAKFEVKLICCFKNDKNLVNFDLSIRNSQKLYFDWFLLCKVYNMWPKRAQRSYLSRHWRVMQNLKKTPHLWFGKWHEEYVKFSLELLKNLKIETLMESFYPKSKMYEVKIFRGVMCHNNEEWCKIWRGIDLSIQNWHEKFHEFWPEHLNASKICTLMGSFWTKYVIFELKQYREVKLHDSEKWCKIWRKTDL